MLWKPFSKAYFTFLSVETTTFFGLLGHRAYLVVDHRGPHIYYPDVFPPHGLKRDIRIPILQSIGIHFNLIVIIALFAATPRMPYPKKIKGIAAGIVLLSILHAAHVYFISYLFIWEYIDMERWPVTLPGGDLQRLINNVEGAFPRAAQPYIVGLHRYWNNFLDEIAPLLIWLYFAYSYLSSKEIVFRNSSASRQKRRKAAWGAS